MAGKKDYQAPNALQSLKTTAVKKEEGEVGGTGKIRQVGRDTHKAFDSKRRMMPKIVTVHQNKNEPMEGYTRRKNKAHGTLSCMAYLGWDESSPN